MNTEPLNKILLTVKFLIGIYAVDLYAYSQTGCIRPGPEIGFFFLCSVLTTFFFWQNLKIIRTNKMNIIFQSLLLAIGIAVFSKMCTEGDLMLAIGKPIFKFPLNEIQLILIICFIITVENFSLRLANGDIRL